jgi:PKD repeat protein
VFYLRLTKSGTNYTGEVSRDGTTWVPAGTVANPMTSPSFGVFAFGPQADGQGDLVAFDYFLLDGEDPTEPCGCTGGVGDEFDGGTLDKTKFNSIIREDDTKYTVQNGMLNVTTVNGDIYTNGDPAPTRNFFLQTADHAPADWTIETKIDVHELSQGYEQAGLLAYKDDDHYVKYDALSDDTNTWLNRIELRSEDNAAILNPQPQVTFTQAQAPPMVWLRLKKTGTNYSGEYSLDGTTWLSIGEPVPNPMTEPSFGLFTLGVNSGGGTAHFDYLEVNGERGCEEPPPENQSPQIQTATASPTIGFAPLLVQFNATATDPDAGDTVSYSWDFGDGSAASTDQNPTHTYTTPGEKTAKLTVTDGKGGTATRNVTVNALEADDADARFRVLVFSKTAGFRHSSIDDGHAAIDTLGADNNFQVDHTEDATAFRDGILSHYDAVVWLSTTGDVLNDTQQGAFERFIRAGNGYAGIHAAADTEYAWKWYGKLVGAYFLSHPAGTDPNGGRDGTVVVEDTTDRSTQGLPAPRWARIDEWYNYKPVNFEQTGDVDFSPRADVHVLASLDESTYDEADGSDGVDDDHPISWCHKYDGGRAWYTGMGHTDDSYTETPFLRHILGGIEEAAGAAGSDICNLSPTVAATADPKTGNAPLLVAFSANGSDPEGQALTYSWEFGDGDTSLRQNPDHRYMEPGTYTAKVTVTDSKGATGTATVEIVVNNPPGNVAPTVAAAGDPTAGKPPLAVQFSATGTDPDGDSLTYAWDFGDGARSLLQNPSHTYNTAGTYTATVTVSDGRGGTATDTVVVTVGNRAPTVQLTATPTSGKAPLTVSFTATGSDPDGDALTYTYDFGDGSKPATGRTPSHKYSKAGTYTAKVTVTDTSGATGSAQVQITVTKK